MVTRNDIRADGSNFLFSLTKLIGKKVSDITFYVTTVDETPLILICDVIFDDGSLMGVEGEHDIPYVTTYAKYPQPNTDDETLQALYDEED